MFHIQKRTADLGSHLCDFSLGKYALENYKESFNYQEMHTIPTEQED